MSFTEATEAKRNAGVLYTNMLDGFNLFEDAEKYGVKNDSVEGSLPEKKRSEEIQSPEAPKIQSVPSSSGFYDAKSESTF